MLRLGFLISTHARMMSQAALLRPDVPRQEKGHEVYEDMRLIKFTQPTK
jgi:hypothetical protein